MTVVELRKPVKPEPLAVIAQSLKSEIGTWLTYRGAEELLTGLEGLPVVAVSDMLEKANHEVGVRLCHVELELMKLHHRQCLIEMIQWKLGKRGNQQTNT